MPFRTTLSIVFWTETTDESEEVVDVIDANLPDAPEGAPPTNMLKSVEVMDYPVMPQPSGVGPPSSNGEGTV